MALNRVHTLGVALLDLVASKIKASTLNGTTAGVSTGQQ